MGITTLLGRIHIRNHPFIQPSPFAQVVLVLWACILVIWYDRVGIGSCSGWPP